MYILTYKGNQDSYKRQICLFELEFYPAPNNIKIMSSQSVNLLTHFPGEA